MKSTVVSFVYNKDGFVKVPYNREIDFKSCETVFVVNVNDKFIQGFDFGKLNTIERKFIKEYFKDQEITNISANKTLSITQHQNAFLNMIFEKSWKKFKKKQTYQITLTYIIMKKIFQKLSKQLQIKLATLKKECLVIKHLKVLNSQNLICTKLQKLN